jgi:hypothetical protein
MLSLDTREEQFWIDSGAKTVRNLAAWLGSARQLKRGADLLRAQWKSDLIELYRRIPSGSFPESVGGPMMLLAGYALENLVKGLLIARNPNAVAALAEKPEQLVYGASARHLSLQLCREADVVLAPHQEDAVRRLEIFLLWAGRYPVPRDARKLGERHSTEERQLESAASFSEIELDVIDVLFTSLAAELEREAVELSALETEVERAEKRSRRGELLRQLDRITPREVGGARVYDMDSKARDEPASQVGCANGCGATFRLSPRTPAAICGCDILHWAELSYDGSLQREFLNVLSYPPC